MASSNFIDYVKINCRSGAGGAGSVHFRREKHTPKGGPDGGDGGRGGHIILRGNSQLWTLLHLKYRKHIKAENGTAGEGGRRSGAQGEDVILEVPLGTIAREPDSSKKLAEITEDGQEIILFAGGRGGLGNDHFKSSTQQAPYYAQTGEAGLEEWVVLELKLLADVGLVGFPNAGKSTLLSVLSAARPEIADYPFTTLVPNLGVVAYRDYKSFVMADIPGIIEGASQGKGLGLRFLRHIERNSVLLFMIPATTEDIRQEYNTLLNELREFNPELMDKTRLLAITKTDLVDNTALTQLKKSLPKKVPVAFISSVSQQGLDELKDIIWQSLTTTAPV
ncbi:GTPase ObgE [Spirosoma validum]|uniref:GTPase Obg n=1 Tax=Spirosoma validum TaxID=2771355 RepID=A0A927AYI9_9BACT|nr:GTPase ObgE [Spirosoma validum]MBD2752037.1 GTPase ObgE [Spirosoma validum]